MTELPVGNIYRWIAADAVNTSIFLNKQWWTLTAALFLPVQGMRLQTKCRRHWRPKRKAREKKHILVGDAEEDAMIGCMNSSASQFVQTVASASHNTSIHYLSVLILHRVTGGLEPVPADIQEEVGYTQDISAVHHRADMQRQTTMQTKIHTCGQFRVTHYFNVCLWTAGGSWGAHRETTQACEKHANSTKNPDWELYQGNAVNHSTTSLEYNYDDLAIYLVLFFTILFS